MGENIFNLLNVAARPGIQPVAKKHITEEDENVPNENQRPNRRQRPRNEKQSTRAEMAASKHAGRIAKQKSQVLGKKNSWDNDSLGELETQINKRESNPRSKRNATNSRDRRSGVPDSQTRRANDRLRQAGGSISQQSDRTNDSCNYEEPPQANYHTRGQSSGGGNSSDVWNHQEAGNAYNDPFNSGAPGRVSSNTFANGNNQNCGNIITSVSSTRRLAPPGGHCHFNVFQQDDDSRNTSNFQPHEMRGGHSKSSRHQQAISAAQNYEAPNYEAKQGYNGNNGRVSANTFANGQNQNVGNQITGRSTTKRIAPPGGVSNIKFY